MFDVLAGAHQPIHFPLPWASEQSFSLLLSPEETRTLNTQAGFREVTWMTDEDQAMQAALAQPNPLGEPAQSGDGLTLAFSPALTGLAWANVQRNMEEGRIRFAMGVFERL